MLIGSTAGPLPRIILAANTFNDGVSGNDTTMDGNKKAMLHIWSCAGPREAQPGDKNECKPDFASQMVDTNSTDGQAATQMSSGVRNLEFVIRDGNPEAIGIRFAGAQTNILSNIKITMEGDAYAGIYSLIGTSSVVENITITGGQIGMHAGDATWPSLSNIRLLNQRFVALGGLRESGPISLNGFEIVKAQPPAISDKVIGFSYLNSTYSGGAYALSDGVIRFTSMSDEPAIENSADRQVTLHNVTIENTSVLVANKTYDVTTASPERTLVKLYAKVVPGYKSNKGTRLGEMAMQSDDLVLLEENPPQPSVDDLLALHGVDITQLPSPDVILAHSKAGDSAYVYVGHEGIQGILRNVTIDQNSPEVTAALQEVLDRPGVKYVLLGRGAYLINDTLELRPETHLFGIANFLSEIETHPAWTTTETVDVVRSPDSASATTTVGFFNIQYTSDPTIASFNGLHWRSGGRSLIYLTSVRARRSPKRAPELFKMRAEYLFDGHGGGRAYGVGPGGMGSQTKWHPNFRNVMVDHTNTPLTFYGLNVEDGGYDCLQGGDCPVDDGTVMQMEIRNASNIAIRGFKCEDFNGVHAFNSTNLFATGIGGCVDWLFVDNSDVLLLNLASKFNASKSATEGDRPLFKQVSGETSIALPRLYALAAVTIGQLPDMSPWYRALGLDDPPTPPEPTDEATATSDPSITPTDTPTATLTSQPTETAMPTDLPTVEPTSTATPTTTATAEPTSTASPTTVPTPTPTVVPTPTSTPAPEPDDGPAKLFLSTTGNATAGGLTFADEDIVAYDLTTGSWSMVFNGSDVGIKASADIDAFTFLDDGSVLFSLDVSTWNVPGVGKVFDEDIVRFVPSQLGSTTAGTFALYFDGSDVGLTTGGEDIDALSLTSSGGILVSTAGAYSVPGRPKPIVGQPQDVLLFTPQQLGEGTSGTWSIYFDGSDIGLTKGTEDVEGLALLGDNDLLLSTGGVFSVTGLSGLRSDVFTCALQSSGDDTTCASITHWWRGVNAGFSAAIDGLAIGY